MFDDEPVKKSKGHEVGMPIDTLSVDELNDRIALLREEIVRLEAAVVARRQTKDTADSIFKF